MTSIVAAADMSDSVPLTVPATAHRSQAEATSACAVMVLWIVTAHGFGDVQVCLFGACMFGAHFQLPPDVRLGEVVTTLHDTASLLLRMAEAPAPTPADGALR